MKNFSFLYQFGHFLVKPAINIFYKIQQNNSKHFPTRGAVFICSNHVNAFMDPISIQLNTKRQIFSLARGDAFKKPVIKWLLTNLKLIPIYRISEGKENLSKNDYTFSVSREVLAKGNPLIIYPESICVQERRIRKLKKGAARIVFGVEEQSNFTANLMILPVGLHYSNPKKFRSTLLINYGEPISSSRFNQLYKQDKAKAINELTAEIESAMQALVVNVEHKENDQLVDDLYVLYKPQLIEELNLNAKNLNDDLKASKNIVNAVNYFQINEPQLVDLVKQKISTYKNSLAQLNFRDHLLNPKGLKTLNGARIIADILLTIIGLPVFLLGIVMNYPPYKLGYNTANKVAKEVEFHASVNLTVGWFSWIGYYLLQLFIVGLVSRNGFVVSVFAILIPLSGLSALNLNVFFKRSSGRRRLFGLKNNNKMQYEKLLSQRNDFIMLLHTAKDKYCQLKKS